MSNHLEIQCSNPHCKTFNAHTQKFCQKCGIATTKRYLRAIGEGVTSYQVGDVINHRYIFVKPNIVLETQPSQIPYFRENENIPNQIIPYLQLFPYRLNIPQVYGMLTSSEQTSDLHEAVWLLDYGSLAITEENLMQGRFFPSLVTQWGQASIMRKLTWLRQIANLWNPLAKKGVVSSLLNPELLAVNGGILHVLELTSTQGQSYSFKDLGNLWQSWQEQVQPDLQDFYQGLCQRLITEKIHNPKQLLTALDYALERYGRSQEKTYQIFTLTDSGPSRDHNEDACYPQAGEIFNFQSEQKVLAIVCDGIGGHEGGEVASKLAIDTLATELEILDLDNEEWSSDEIINHLQKSTFMANTKITEKNDQENRQERQRMGTTLVMGLIYNHQVYLTHVGDSRIYLITRNGVYQLTLDDDLASREVRLGYALYRDAVRYPSAGALVQALGMGSSQNLHPTTQQLTFDEDCLFLLCSDGLSDFDRIDQYWDKEILPLLNGEENIATVGHNLIALANSRNGHDNATIALVYCQVKQATVDKTRVLLPWQEIDQLIPQMLPTALKIEQSNSAEANIATEPLYQENDEPKKPFVLFASLIIVLLVIGTGFFFRKNIADLFAKLTGVSIPQATTQPTPVTTTTASPTQELPNLQKDGLYILNTSVNMKLVETKTDKEIPEKSIIQLLEILPKNPETGLTKALIKVCYIEPKTVKPSPQTEATPAPTNENNNLEQPTNQATPIPDDPNVKIAIPLVITGEQGQINLSNLKPETYQKYELAKGQKPPKGILNECLVSTTTDTTESTETEKPETQKDIQTNP
jgi:protein phosphatase